MKKPALKDILYAPPLLIEAHQGINLVLDPEAPNWISTNRPGLDIIRLVDGDRTVEEIADHLRHEWRKPKKDVRIVVSDYLAELQALGILSSKRRSYLPYMGRPKTLSDDRLMDMSLCVTNRSNYNISHWPEENDYELSGAEVVELIDVAANLGCRSVTLTGGEPMLRHDIQGLIEYITKRGLKLSLMTNASLITSEMARNLRPSEIDFAVYLDGSSAQINDRLNGEGSFRETVAGLRRLVAAGHKPTVLTTIAKTNVRDIANLPEILVDLGIYKLKLLWVRQRSNAGGNRQTDMAPNAGSVLGALRALEDKLKHLPLTVLNQEYFKDNLREPGVKTDLCNGGLDHLAVYANGDVYPCHWLFGRTRFKLGNVRDELLGDILTRSRDIQKLRRNSVQKISSCYLCHLKFFCGGLGKCYTSCAHLPLEELLYMGAEEGPCLILKEIIKRNLVSLAGNPDYDADHDLPVVLSSMDRSKGGSEGTPQIFGDLSKAKPFSALIV